MNKAKYIMFFILLCTICGCSTTKETNKLSNINPEDIAISYTNSFEYDGKYTTREELINACDLIVYAEITNIEYTVSAYGFCRTNLEIEVIEDLKGTTHSGNKIRLIKDQGITTAEQYLNSFPEEMKKEIRKDFSEYSDEELNSLYIQQMEYGDVMSEIGQKRIYYLAKSAFYDTDQTYTTILGPMFDYIEVSEGKFMDTQYLGFHLSEPYYLKENSEIVLNADSQFEFTLEEIKEKDGLN